MQADHDVPGGAGLDDAGEAIKLFGGEKTTGIFSGTAVQTNDQPVADLFVRTVGKGRHATHALHEFANVMIARHAVDAHIERRHQIPKPIVGCGRIVLDQVSGNDNPIRFPFAGLIMIEHSLQGFLRDSATQSPFGIGEKMRIRQVQDPN